VAWVESMRSGPFAANDGLVIVADLNLETPIASASKSSNAEQVLSTLCGRTFRSKPAYTMRGQKTLDIYGRLDVPD